MSIKDFQIMDPGNVTWADVVGQDEAVAALRDAIELPYTHSEIYAAYGQKPCKGVLLWGPPGCGKTMLAKAAANAALTAKIAPKKITEKDRDEEMREALGAMFGPSFATMFGPPRRREPELQEGRPAVLYLKGGELKHPLVGQTESMIRGMFAEAREASKITKRRTILFIDEAEAMLPDRSVWGFATTTVPTFLSELDGINSGDDVFIILATNRASQIDPAIQRDGRIDRRIKVARPNREAALQIAAGALGARPLCAGLECGVAASALVEQAWIANVAELHADIGGEHKILHMTLSDIISGAIVVGIVNRATQFAITRDVAAGVKAKVTGITLQDIAAAVDASAREQRTIDHSSTWAEKVGDSFKPPTVRHSNFNYN